VLELKLTSLLVFCARHSNLQSRFSAFLVSQRSDSLSDDALRMLRAIRFRMMPYAFCWCDELAEALRGELCMLMSEMPRERVQVELAKLFSNSTHSTYSTDVTQSTRHESCALAALSETQLGSIVLPSSQCALAERLHQLASRLHGESVSIIACIEMANSVAGERTNTRNTWIQWRWSNAEATQGVGLFEAALAFSPDSIDVLAAARVRVTVRRAC
jgi:hypothetical protein